MAAATPSSGEAGPATPAKNATEGTAPKTVAPPPPGKVTPSPPVAPHAPEADPVPKGPPPIPKPGARPTPSTVGHVEQGGSADIFPWEAHPQLVARVEAYLQNGVGQSWRCRSNETLRFAKDEALGPGIGTEFSVFPDAVVSDGIPLSPLMRLWLFVLGIPAILIAGPAAIVMAIPMFFLGLLLYPFGLIWALIEKAKYNYIARKIRANPKAPYAIKKMFQLTPLAVSYTHLRAHET